MKKTALKSLALKAVSVAIVAVSMANVANATDWTPYLKSIQHHCNYEALAKDLMAKKVPANLKADVVKQTAKHRKIRKEYYADEDIASIQLKNATAFGAPLQKISYKSVVGEGSGEAEYVLHFANANFIKALPLLLFKLQVIQIAVLCRQQDKKECGLMIIWVIRWFIKKPPIVWLRTKTLV